jgi:hypothetical protein
VSATSDLRAYLAPGAFVDSDAKNVVAFARRAVGGETDQAAGTSYRRTIATACRRKCGAAAVM